MVDGINIGMEGFGAGLPSQVKESPQDYALSLVVCTDGVPDDATTDYKELLDHLKDGIEESVGVVGRPTVTSIGFGNNLKSTLLASFSDVFLHIPDPGSVGPFMVNLVASTRSIAKIVPPGAGGGGIAANATRLIMEPASEVLAVPGFQTSEWRGGAAVAVDIGAIQYDQLRHILVRTASADSNLSVCLEVSGHEVATANATVNVPPLEAAPDDSSAKAFRTQLERVGVLSCLTATKGQLRSSPLPAATKLACLEVCEALLGEGTLKETLKTEVLLALSPDKFKTWGGHYVTTLPFMLRLERRSNFRDICLQEFGKDGNGQDGIFEELSNEAELVFAQLKPPTPSALNHSSSSSSSSHTTYTTMPDEFMRGGGCFGPESCVALVRADGSAQPARVSEVKAGDILAGEGGRCAQVRCVVMTECTGGRAQLTRLPSGLEITEWHPIREASTGRWRFPHMIGAQVVKKTPYVYNFVLAPGHPTILVEGVPCAALGHGIADDPVASHPYWGTDAVLNDLMRRPGWGEGRVVLMAHSVSTSH